MASLTKRGVEEYQKKVPEDSREPEPGCCEKFCDWCQSIFGKGSSSEIKDNTGNRKQATFTEENVPDKNKNGSAPYDCTNMKGGQYADTKATTGNVKSNYGQVSEQLYQKQENSFGSPGLGEKSTGPKRPENLAIFDKDTNTKTSISFKSDQSLNKAQENSYGGSADRSYGIPGVGDRNMGSTQLDTLGKSGQDAKTKTDGSLKRAQSLQNQQEHGYGSYKEGSNGSPGGVVSTQLETIGSSDQDTKTKTASSLKPAQSYQNQQEHRYGCSMEKSNGSPLVGDRKMGSTQLETLASSYQDTKIKTGSSLKPGQSLPNQQENSYGSPGVRDRKMGPVQLENLARSYQDAKTKTSRSLEQGQSLQYSQENRNPEQLVHKPSAKGDARQEVINVNSKDPNPHKETISPFKYSSAEQPKASPKIENNLESQTNKINCGTQQVSLPPKNEKQKDLVKQTSFRDKDNIGIDTRSPKTLKSGIAYPSAEQETGIPKQEKSTENPINTRLSSPTITNFSTLGQGQAGQFQSKEQEKSVAKQEGISKDDKNKGKFFLDLT